MVSALPSADTVLPQISQAKTMTQLLSSSFARLIRKSVLMPVLLAMLVGIIGSACANTRTTTVRDVFTEGGVTSATPPQLIGTRAQKGSVALSGSMVESISSPRTDKALMEGGSGNAILRRQAKGSLSVGASESVALGISGRYSASTWGRDSQAIDGEANSIEGSMGGVGFMTRIGFVDNSDFELNLDLETEVISIPYYRRVIGTETTEVWDEDLDDWVLTETSLLDPRRLRKSELAMTAHIGLSTAIRLDNVTLIGGAGLQVLPTIDGHQRVTTVCDEYNDCTGPESLDDVDVHQYQTIFTGYAGLEVGLNDYFSLLGVVFGGFTEFDTGLATPGASATLRLTI